MLRLKQSKTSNIGIGSGYVKLPLVVEFIKFKLMGVFDRDLESGHYHTSEVTSVEIKELENLAYTSDIRHLENLSFFVNHCLRSIFSFNKQRYVTRVLKVFSWLTLSLADHIDQVCNSITEMVIHKASSISAAKVVIEYRFASIIELIQIRYQSVEISDAHEKFKGVSAKKFYALSRVLYQPKHILNKLDADLRL
ncbi:hypothetical protein [Acinetobacter soli]|uniref:hypothetical protein n=1 Tax=Acinetobacter soli TaxID=487316 RepID=UPI002587E598|nr:hypothetical protein [uncultured Acinetobacter sp.]